MSKQRPVIPGEVFHKLTVLEQVASHPISKNRMVRCACACGNEAVKDWSSVWRGKTRSCGCMKADKARANGYASKTHGKRYSREYAIWRGLHTRCYNVSDPGYRNYGALGIKVCDRWHKFENFYADMGDRPEGLTLDRIDNDGPYSPENCRWASNKEQASNRRNTVFVLVGGVLTPFLSACESAGFCYRRVYYYMRSRGLSRQEAFDLCASNVLRSKQ